MRHRSTPRVRTRPNWRVLAQPQLWILALTLLVATIAAVQLGSTLVYAASVAAVTAAAGTPWMLQAFRNAGAHWREEHWTDACGGETRQLSVAESIAVPEPRWFGRQRSRPRLARFCIRDGPRGIQVFVATTDRDTGERKESHNARQIARAMPVRYDGDEAFVTEQWTEGTEQGVWQAPHPLEIIDTLYRSTRLRIATPERHAFARTIVFRADDADAQQRLHRFMERAQHRTDTDRQGSGR